MELERERVVKNVCRSRNWEEEKGGGREGIGHGRDLEWREGARDKLNASSPLNRRPS